MYFFVKSRRKIYRTNVGLTTLRATVRQLSTFKLENPTGDSTENNRAKLTDTSMNSTQLDLTEFLSLDIT